MRGQARVENPGALRQAGVRGNRNEASLCVERDLQPRISTRSDEVKWMTRIPISGTIVPNMGRSKQSLPARGVASALFTPVQQRVLGLLFGQPQRRFQSAEIIRLANSGTGAVHRQLQRLVAAGLVDVVKDGNQKYYQASGNSPVFAELSALITKTSGLLDPIRRALARVTDRIDAAFVYGSIAKGTDRATSDVDLLIVGDHVEYGEVYEALQVAEKAIARSINPTIMKRSEWRRKRSGRDSFASRINAQAKLFIFGDENVLR
jgi:predicted nucleotidyltransferase